MCLTHPVGIHKWKRLAQFNWWLYCSSVHKRILLDVWSPEMYDQHNFGANLNMWISFSHKLAPVSHFLTLTHFTYPNSWHRENNRTWFQMNPWMRIFTDWTCDKLSYCEIQQSRSSFCVQSFLSALKVTLILNDWLGADWKQMMTCFCFTEL